MKLDKAKIMAAVEAELDRQIADITDCYTPLASADYLCYKIKDIIAEGVIATADEIADELKRYVTPATIKADRLSDLVAGEYENGQYNNSYELYCTLRDAMIKADNARKERL